MGKATVQRFDDSLGAMSRKSQPKDRIDGYVPTFDTGDPWKDRRVEKELKLRAQFDAYESDNFDGFKNVLTGIGDWTKDKTFGGRQSGPDFDLVLVPNTVAESRWRGSDLGGRIIETIPDEMTREGWEMTIQPDDDEEEDSKDPPGKQSKQKKADAFPPGQPGAGPPTPPPSPMTHPALAGMPEAPQEGPKPLPRLQDDMQEEIEEIEGALEELGAAECFWEAACYERAYGGAAILIGADDGMNPTEPLDEERISEITFLNTLTGGWDGEVVAWSWYQDPMAPNYGKPEMYMVRNMGVPIARVPAPGQNMTEHEVIPGNDNLGYGNLVTWVHESRLLVFPGTAVSRRARVQMRGWGDSIFTRVDRVLSQYDQTWGGVANLMTDFSQAYMKIKGLAEQIGGNNKRGTQNLTKRAMAFKLSRSIANIAFIDAEEEFGRDTASLAGISDTLQQFALRLAAAADMPVDLLMGQTAAGGLNKGDTTYRFFADRIVARQRKHLLPQLKRLVKLLMLSKDGPTKGKEPGRWTVAYKSPYQMTEQEKAQLRLTSSQADDLDIKNQVLSPEEVAASAYGGSDYSANRVIDIEGRNEKAEQDEKDKAERVKAMVQTASEAANKAKEQEPAQKREGNLPAEADETQPSDKPAAA